VSTSSARVVYQVADRDAHNILIDFLGHALSRLTRKVRSDLKWSVFDLNWEQREDGLFHWDSVCRRSQQRPNGLQLEEGGLRLLHANAAQVIDGLFVAAPEPVLLPAGQPDEAAVLASEIALQAFDAGFWRFTCRDDEVARSVVAGLTKVTIVDAPPLRAGFS
jgi:hypothetical protein